MKYKQYIVFILFLVFPTTTISFAQGNIVDYFLKSPESLGQNKEINP